MIIDFIAKAIVIFLLKMDELFGKLFWLLLLIGICMLIPGEAGAATPTNGVTPPTEIVECIHCNSQLVTLD